MSCNGIKHNNCNNNYSKYLQSIIIISFTVTNNEERRN